MNDGRHQGIARRCSGGKAAVLAGLVLAGWPAAGDSVSLQTVSRLHGFQSLSVRGKSAVLLTRFHSLELERDSRRAVFDGVIVWLNAPVSRSWGRLVMAREDLDTTVIPLVNPRLALGAAGFRTVALDAGHGGEDRGASMAGRGVAEKALTLEVVLAVRDILARCQVPVRLIRDTDRAVSLEERPRLAARMKADLLVSVHFNAAASTRPSGIETYILPPAGFPSTSDPGTRPRERGAVPGNRHDAANTALGFTLQQSLRKYTRAEDRGLRRARFVVLRDAPCPAALVECGFMSNPAEQAKLATAAYRRQIARGLAEGILAYLRAVQRAQGLKP